MTNQSDKFIPMLLGTDINSYTVAYSIFDAYKIKPVVLGSAVLIPFYKTKIAKIYTEKEFSSNNEVFVALINRAYRENADKGQKVIFFASSERYLHQLYDNADSLDFEFVIPYPEKDLAKLVSNKTSFYEKMEDIDVKIPLTRSVSYSNYTKVLEDFPSDIELFMKAEEFAALQDTDIEGIKKGYYQENLQAALKDLDYLYKENSFKGNFIVQEYIHGGLGTEYSVNGYRSDNDEITFIQARSLLDDTRDIWIGNHIVLVDHHDQRLLDISRKVVEMLGYYGLFNFDFKIDSKTGEIYLLECNPRVGRSFFYGNLGGVNLPQVIIEDKIFNNHLDQKHDKKFNWIVASHEINKKAIDKDLLEIYMDKDRVNNSFMVLDNVHDDGFLRKMKLKDYQKSLDNIYKNVFDL